VSGLSAVILDCYNTLIDLDRVHEATVAKILERAGSPVDPALFHSYWDVRERRNLEEAVSRGRAGFVLQAALNVKSLRETFEHFGIDGDAESGVELWVELTRRCAPFPDARPALAELGEARALAVVSNADNYPLLDILRREGLEFEQVVTSETARAYKPDSRIFRFALKALGRSAADSVYVGDTPRVDVPGAARLGMSTVWLNRKGRPLSPDEPAADITVAGLAGLAAELERLG